MSQYYKNGNGGGGGGSGNVTASITTTNATPTTILTFPLIPNQTLTLNATIACYGPADPSSLNGSLVGGGYRGPTGGAIAAMPVYINQIETLDLTTATFGIVASGNNILIQVTGQAGLTLDWKIVSLFVYVT
jgi:hypothetical protein